MISLKTHKTHERKTSLKTNCFKLAQICILATPSRSRSSASARKGAAGEGCRSTRCLLPLPSRTARGPWPRGSESLAVLLFNFTF